MRSRSAVRVLLLSQSNRVLLIYCRNRMSDTPPTIWATPGGGIEDGESIEQAARRELREELSVREIEVGPVVVTEVMEVMDAGQPVQLHQSYVLAFAAHERFDLNGSTPEERDELLTARWWSLDELRGSNEPIVPVGLADLLETVLRTPNRTN